MDKVLAFWANLGKASKIGIVATVIVGYILVHGLLVNAGLVAAEKPAAPPVAERIDVVAPAASAPTPELVIRPYLRATLHDWGSYESVSYSEPEIVMHKGKNVYHVSHAYRAKNGLGGFRLVHQDFYYTHGGEMVDVSEAK